MDATEPASPPRRRSSLLRWLGLAPSPLAGSLPAAPLPEPDPVQAAIRAAAAEIGDFLALHHLQPTHSTLAAALDCITGADPRLADTIHDRRAEGLPVTGEWLFELLHPPSPEDEVKAMAHLMDRIEQGLAEFSRTTLDAQAATSEYSTALRTHVDDLAAVGQAGAALTEIVALARTMLERTRIIEGQIARAEAETRTLHRNLEDARNAAEIDHLTGLPNRRAFEGRLDREVLAARAAGEPLCVAFCDIDRFKRINDTHGHEAGDRVLRVVARALGEISDDRCHVARHGGEEFVVLLRGQTLAQAFATLDETRALLADRRLVNRANDIPFGKVTFSAGIADVLAYPDPRTALKAADEALYVAKKDGRNRVTRAPVRLTPVQSPKAA